MIATLALGFLTMVSIVTLGIFAQLALNKTGEDLVFTILSWGIVIYLIGALVQGIAHL